MTEAIGWALLLPVLAFCVWSVTAISDAAERDRYSEQVALSLAEEVWRDATNPRLSVGDPCDAERVAAKHNLSLATVTCQWDQQLHEDKDGTSAGLLSFVDHCRITSLDDSPEPLPEVGFTIWDADGYATDGDKPAIVAGSDAVATPRAKVAEPPAPEGKKSPTVVGVSVEVECAPNSLSGFRLAPAQAQVWCERSNTFGLTRIQQGSDDLELAAGHVDALRTVSLEGARDPMIGTTLEGDPFGDDTEPIAPDKTAFIVIRSDAPECALAK